MKNNKIIKKHTAECVCLYGRCVPHVHASLRHTHYVSAFQIVHVWVLSNLMSILWSVSTSKCASTCHSGRDYANTAYSMHEHVWAHIIRDYTLLFLSKTFLWSLGWCTRQSNHEIDTQSCWPEHIHIQMNHLNGPGHRMWAFLVTIHQHKISAFQFVLFCTARIGKHTVIRTFSL